MKKIDLTNFEGTADRLGEQVFEQLIAPMLDEMKSQDTDSAKLFAFSILWLGLASYASQFEPEGAKKSILQSCKAFRKQAQDAKGPG